MSSCLPTLLCLHLQTVSLGAFLLPSIGGGDVNCLRTAFAAARKVWYIAFPVSFDSRFF